MKKKLLIISIFIAAVTLSFKTGFAADIKYVYTQQSELTQGVTLTTYDIFMSDRNWNRAYAVSADLNYPHLSMRVLPNAKGVNHLTTVSDIANAYDTTLAINSDFFNWGTQSGRGSPIGAVYFEGKMVSSPASSDGMYTIMQDMSRNVFAQLVDYKIIITAPNGEEKQIAGKNKASDLSQVMMYDSGYAEYSLGSTETQYEVVVRGGKVDEIRFSSEPVRFEGDMYVLAGLSDWDSFILDNFSVGDKVELKEESSTDFNSLQLAAGAGAKLLSDGNIVQNFSHVIGGTNPRTAFGIAENQRTVYFVVVEGRSNLSNGMSMGELAAFMRYIGAYNAVNLDGGGSSTLVAKDLQSGDQRLVNTPSDGAQRKVALGLGVTSSAKKTGSLYHLKITADGENAFKNSRINLSVAGFDEYYYPVDINHKELSYSVSGVKGYFEGDTFFPTSAGTATITAHMPNGANASICLRILDAPYKIEHEASIINTSVGVGKDFWIFGRDENGYIAHVPICDTKVTFSDNIAHVDNTAIIGDRKGSALVSIKFGDAIIYAVLHVDSDSTFIPLPADKTARDSQNKTGTQDSNNSLMTFAVFGSVRESDTLFNNLIMKKSLAALNSSADRAFILSTKATSNIAPNMTIPTSTCYPFGSFAENGSVFMTLDTEDRFMSAKEWMWFIDEAKKVKSGNLFVFMQTDVSFTSTRETQLLKDILSEVASRGVNVYAFCSGNDTFLSPENGVRYIKTPGFADDIKASGFASMSAKLQYILVDIASDGSVGYRFVPIYQQF